ncbi:MAG: alcohol dehydrogenase catalytic domain-containing protein [Phycisphaerales bacterium JB059]
MRALRYDGQHVLLDPRAPAPTPEPGEALVRPTRVAIGPAEVAICRGEIPFTGVLGSEFVGVVEHVEGEEQSALAGARGVCSPTIVPPTCELAKRGLPEHSPERTVMGVRGRDGALCDRVCVPAINLAPVPPAIDEESAAMSVVLSRALHLARMVATETKPYITILGDNAIALLAAQSLHAINASVRVLGTREARFMLCEKWGIKHRHLDDAGRRFDQDVVLVCERTPAMLDAAMGMIRPRGRVVLSGDPEPAPGAAEDLGLDATRLVEQEIRVMGARGGRPADALRAMTSAPRPFDLASLITRRAKLDDGVSALRAAGEPDALRVLVEV